MEEIILQVEGMSCGHCVKTIEGTLKKLGASGKVDLVSESVMVSYDESTLSLDSIKEAIEEQGYDVL